MRLSNDRFCNEGHIHLLYAARRNYDVRIRISISAENLTTVEAL